MGGGASGSSRSTLRTMETLLRQPTIFGHGLRKGRKKEGGRRRKRRRERKDGACIGG